MKCTSCNTGTLSPSYLDHLFPCHTCDHCGGNWILLPDYLAWKEAHPDFQFSVEAGEPIAEDHKQAMLCPVSGRLMVKYRISSKSDRRLDLSPAVNGIWLDKGEWALLKQEGLAGNLNRIFTDPWQRQIREESARETFTHLYEREFGAEDYAKVKAFREWLWQHPQKLKLLAYLTDEDPYSALR